MMESGLNKHTALHVLRQSEHTCWLVTAQYVPNTGSVNPPEDGQDQSALLPVLTCTGAVLQMVAASFQALHAAESPVLKGNTPPSAVASVALYEVVVQPGIGHG
jgi:hypothetical protein